MMKKLLPAFCIAWIFCAAPAGCTSVNQPLNAYDVPLERRVRNHTLASTLADAVPMEADDDGYFVGIAISGGGSRSANFSAACLFQLQRLGLLHHADYISSVSGGSLTAAYYCLNEQDWNPQAVQKKLTHSFASDVIGRSLLPWNFFILMLSDWDRTDLMADSFRQHLFSRDGKALTFGDLRKDRPRLLINATNLQSGRRFIFCNENFDEINSDLSRYPIASAVAASAAFPVVMHPVTLRDYSTIFKQYRHLIDGGVTDNLGIQSLVETYDAHVKSAARLGMADPYPRGAVLILIDARTQFNAKIAEKSDTGFGSLELGTGLTSTALLDRVGSATMSEIIVRYSPDDVTAKTLRGQIDELDKIGYLTLKDSDGRPVRVVHVALSRVRDLHNLPFGSFNETLNNIATYFNIGDHEAYNLYQAAELLMEGPFEPRLKEIVAELVEADSKRVPSASK